MRSPRPSQIAGLPAGPGVYRFRDEHGRALYIGRAVDLRRRVASYWSDLRDRRHLRRMVPQIVAVEAVACESAHEAAWLERNLLERSKPRWNRVRGGLEVPAYIHLERRSGAARLTVAHQPQPIAAVEVFGPYLGGTQTRLAVSGLDRVLPLAYADHQLTGSLRDMARARGADLLDRETLLATVISVLRRERDAIDAVMQQLAQQRDKASAALAFELAARVQQEIEALDWVVASQQVTTLDPVDHDVYGWADGLLVHFEIRKGRMCTWRQRDCSAPTARQYLDQTPAAWRAFATRNAELASRLANA